MKKKYIKPISEAVNFWLEDDDADSFSMPGEVLTGSIKDQTSDTPGVKGEVIWEDDECGDGNDGYIHQSKIWKEEW